MIEILAFIHSCGSTIFVNIFVSKLESLIEMALLLLKLLFKTGYDAFISVAGMHCHFQLRLSVLKAANQSRIFQLEFAQLLVFSEKSALIDSGRGCEIDALEVFLALDE